MEGRWGVGGEEGWLRLTLPYQPFCVYDVVAVLGDFSSIVAQSQGEGTLLISQ